MKRKEFFKNGAILLSLGSVLNGCSKENAVMASSGEAAADAGTACNTTPSEVAGPYEIDLIKNSTIYRSDIREDRTGLPLDLRLQVNEVNANCAPIKNARVDIWHCDKDGYYSGFVNDGYLGAIDNSGKTFYVASSSQIKMALSILLRYFQVGIPAVLHTFTSKFSSIMCR